MAHENSHDEKSKLSKSKIYSVSFGIFLLVNFGFEAGISLLENRTHKWLYPIFPFTRVGLLVITIMIARAYIRRREHRPKQKLWWRVVRPILLIVVIYGLIMGAWLNVSQADADRTAEKIEKARQTIESLPVPTKTELNTTYEAN